MTLSAQDPLPRHILEQRGVHQCRLLDGRWVSRVPSRNGGASPPPRRPHHAQMRAFVLPDSDS